MNIRPRIGVVIEKDGEYLLIKHENNAGEQYWVLPGGGQEPAETVPECAAREVKEETGLDVECTGVLSVNDDIRKDAHILNVITKAHLLGGELRTGESAEPDNDTVIDTAFFALEEISELDVRPHNLEEYLLLETTVPYKG